jgi:hypothetical protein
MGRCSTDCPIDRHPKGHYSRDYLPRDHYSTDCRPKDYHPTDYRPMDSLPMDSLPMDCRPMDYRPTDCRSPAGCQDRTGRQRMPLLVAARTPELSPAGLMRSLLIV